MFLLLRVHVLANQSYTKQCNTGDDNEIWYFTKEKIEDGCIPSTLVEEI